MESYSSAIKERKAQIRSLKAKIKFDRLNPRLKCDKTYNLRMEIKIKVVQALTRAKALEAISQQIKTKHYANIRLHTKVSDKIDHKDLISPE